MTLEEIRHFFAWGAALNYGILLLWLALCLGGRSLMLGICSKIFRISEDAYDTANFYGIMYYKLGIMIFFLTPYIALRIMR